MADTVAQEEGIRVGEITSEGETETLAIGPGLRSARLEKWSNEARRGGRQHGLYRSHRHGRLDASQGGQSERAGPAQEVDEERLDRVVQRVTGQHRLGPMVVRDTRQRGVAELSTRVFEPQATGFGVCADVHFLELEDTAGVRGEGADECRVALRVGATKAMLDVGDDQRPLSLRANRKQTVEQTAGILTTGDRHDEPGIGWDRGRLERLDDQSANPFYNGPPHVTAPVDPSTSA